MKINARIALSSAALAVMMLPAMAQINQRKENQQDRIANGVASGELTAGETANIEKKESNLNKEEKLSLSSNQMKLKQSVVKVMVMEIMIWHKEMETNSTIAMVV